MLALEKFQGLYLGEGEKKRKAYVH